MLHFSTMSVPSEPRPVKLGYWDCRGLINHVKLLLVYTGTPYTFRAIECGPAPHFDKEAWRADRYALLPGHNYPNLPYYEDDDYKLTHTNAILAYLGRKHDLGPETERERVDVDMLREQAVDLVQCVVEYVYFPEHRAKGTEPPADLIESKCKRFECDAKRILVDLNRKHGKSKGKWMLDDKLTYVDFMLYEYIDFCRLLSQDILQGMENLELYMEYFENLPRVKEYLASSQFKRFPIFGERSYLGRKPES